MFYRETVAPAAVVGGGGAPDVMVVPVTDGGGGVGTGPGGPLSGSGAGQEVSANVTVETTRASSVAPQPATSVAGGSGKATFTQSSAKQQIVQLGIPHDVLLGESETTVQ